MPRMNILNKFLRDIRADWLRTPYHRSEHDRWVSATQNAPLEHLVAANDEATRIQYSTSDALTERLAETFGLKRGELYRRCITGHFGVCWYVGPFMGTEHLFHCLDRTPSESGQDWYCDALDMAIPFTDRVIVRDRYTLVMTDGEGVDIVETGLRCPPRKA